MTEIINCPFCGCSIEKEGFFCPSCGSLFVEPKLSTIKFQEFGWFFALYFISKGWFGILWFLINAKAINSMTTTSKDKLKLNWLIIIFILGIIVYLSLSSNVSPWTLTAGAFILFYFLYAALSYRTLRIIQKYTKVAFNVDIEINPNYIVLFNIFYLIHFIDTYTSRVQQTHEHFAMKIPYLIMLIIIFSIAPVALFLFNPPLYGFWIFFNGLLGI